MSRVPQVPILEPGSAAISDHFAAAARSAVSISRRKIALMRDW
jgi:hypothetical protein